MKNKMVLLFLLVCVLWLAVACNGIAEKTTVRAAFLKGPTGMGAARLMDQNAQSLAANDYVFTVAGTPDMIVAQLITGELDIAALPSNMLAMLNTKTDGAIQSLAVNTLGTLYLLERGELVSAPDDLKDREIVCAGQGTTVQATVELLFEDVAITYVAEHAEAIAQVAAGRFDLVILPEPFATSLLQRDIGFRVALDIGALWLDGGNGVLPMGGIAVRKAFADQHPEAVAAFIDEYSQSVQFANENPQAAAVLIEKYDILSAAVAEASILRAGMVCLTDDAMREALSAYYAVLMDVNPALIGGALPGDDFYRAR